jgi:hypothetical protein
MMVMNKEKYAEIGRKIREIPLEPSSTSYEWEELVQKMYASDDAGLHEIGVRELEILRQKCPKCPLFNTN